MLWVGGHHDRGIHGGLGADSRRYAGVCQGLGGYSLPKTLRIGQIRGYSLPRPSKLAKIGGFGQVPGAAPQPRGQAPQAGGRNLVKIGGYLIILQFGTEIAPSLQWFLVNGSRGVPPGDQFLGPRIPPDSPRGAPRPKSGKSRVSRGRPKSRVSGVWLYGVQLYWGMPGGLGS